MVEGNYCGRWDLQDLVLVLYLRVFREVMFERWS